MTASRVDTLLGMLQRNPLDSRVLFALAAEYEKQERWPDVVTTLRDYLARADDQGNAWGRLGNALARLGQMEEAAQSYTKGIEAANRHGHPGMAAEFEEQLSDLGD